MVDSRSATHRRPRSNHRFLGLGTVPWRTPAGRSHTYVHTLLADCRRRLDGDSETSAEAEEQGGNTRGADGQEDSSASAADTSSEKHLHIITGVRARQIHGRDKVLELADGRRLPYDALILAGRYAFCVLP